MLNEFYPTPETLLDKVFEGFDWNYVESILEPSAGKGDIVDYIRNIRKNKYYTDNLDIDCIEMEDVLRKTLQGKNYRVVHDDFLTFRTFKHYDLIVMNPPFSNGAAHLMKALEMQKYGGTIICILNAETLKNPYTNERKALMQKLSKLNAQIEYLQNEFSSAERKTDVEIALVKVFIPEDNKESFFFTEMKKKEYAEFSQNSENTEVADRDIVKSAVLQYTIELEAGVTLIREYERMKPHILRSLGESTYNEPIISLKVNNHDCSINEYVKSVRMKYWRALFENPVFTAGMTNKLRENYNSKVRELADYDFSLYNIRTLQIDMMQSMVSGIEDCIMELFNEFTRAHSWYPECENNIHYYNGWATNKAWIINKKVIIPLSAYRTNYKGQKELELRYSVLSILNDIEKVFDYLDGGKTTLRLSLSNVLQVAESTNQTKNIHTTFFDVTFFKKGTCHIVFNNDELLKKFNIFAARQNNWLPQEYGRKHYREMSKEAQQVVNEFEGSEINYENTLANADYYLYNPEKDVLRISQAS